jgi:hypothetical protein
VTELHQLLLDENRAGAVEVIAHSFTEDAYDKVESWSRDLVKFKRLSDEHEAPPREAFSFLKFSNDAAILHRVNTGNDTGRNFSHAVVGPFEVLRDLALPLAEMSWLLPEEQDKRIESIDDDELSHQCGIQAKTMRMRAPAKPLVVRSLLAAVLETPGVAFSVMGVEPELAPQVLFLVRDIVQAIGGGPERSWTYSTFEVSDEPQDFLPEFVFMPRFPQGTEIDPHRRRVNIQEIRGREAMFSLADLLCTEYRNLRVESFRKEIRQWAGKADTFAERVRNLMSQRAGAVAANIHSLAGHQATVDGSAAEPGKQSAEPAPSAQMPGNPGPDQQNRPLDETADQSRQVAAGQRPGTKPLSEAGTTATQHHMMAQEARQAESNHVDFFGATDSLELSQPPDPKPVPQGQSFQCLLQQQPPPPPPAPADFAELQKIQDVNQLCELLARGNHAHVTPAERQQLWTHWQDGVLAAIVRGNMPTAFSVSAFQLALDFLTWNGGAKPTEIDQWLRSLHARPVFHDQLDEHSFGAKLAAPPETRWLSRSDLMIMVTTSIILLFGTAFGIVLSIMFDIGSGGF